MEISHVKHLPWDEDHPLHYHNPHDLLNLCPYQVTTVSSLGTRVESLKATVVFPTGRGLVLDTQNQTVNLQNDKITEDEPAGSILQQIRELPQKPIHLHIRYRMVNKNLPDADINELVSFTNFDLKQWRVHK